jgi:stress response protein YsnF
VLVDQPLAEEHVDIDRVVVNQMVDEPPPVRYEGDTLIVPVLEEVIVVDVRLMVREEVRITRRREQVHKPQSVTLRREDVIVEPVPDAEGTGRHDAEAP